jgi:hypothetical protein
MAATVAAGAADADAPTDQPAPTEVRFSPVTAGA